jgi:TPR repeat protein
MDHGGTTVVCCADCGGVAGGGISLKACKSCMLVKYCNAECQRNHWPRHKKVCKHRAAELRDEALFKDPPAKEDCPICFLPMPHKLIACISLPPATLMSVPVYDLSEANKELAQVDMKHYYSCCGKSICKGCVHSFCKSGNMKHCPYCKAEILGKTDEEKVEEIMRRVEANDAGAIYALGNYYYHGNLGLLRDREKAIELYARAAELGSSQAHFDLGTDYDAEGNSKKEKFHNEAAAMAGHETARCNLGCNEAQSGNMERAVKHWIIAASAGCYNAMNNMLVAFYKGLVSRDEIDSTLTAYNNSCAEMRSEARDAFIQVRIDHP